MKIKITIKINQISTITVLVTMIKARFTMKIFRISNKIINIKIKIKNTIKHNHNYCTMIKVTTIEG